MEIAILVGVVAGLVMVYSLVARYFPVYEETIVSERPAREPSQLEQSSLVEGQVAAR